MPRTEQRPPAAAEPADEDLLVRVARAERDALRILYERFAQRVYASAIKHTTDGEVASDIVQDVFLAVWVGARGYRPERGNAEQWLFAITRNKIQDHWRRLGRLTTALGEGVDFAPRAEPSRADTLDKRQSAARALAALTPEQRELVELVYLKDLRFQEAARVLGIPLGTVKSRIHTALAAMRAAVEGSR
jgi:RNA polymerase sigma-70 factor (ECF subfamily)